MCITSVEVVVKCLPLTDVSRVENSNAVETKLIEFPSAARLPPERQIEAQFLSGFDLLLRVKQLQLEMGLVRKQNVEYNRLIVK